MSAPYQHPDQRKNRRLCGQVILQNLDLFKVCQGCDAILKRDTRSCPACNTYRFDFSAAGVRAATEHALNR